MVARNHEYLTDGVHLYMVLAAERDPAGGRLLVVADSVTGATRQVDQLEAAILRPISAPCSSR